MSEHAANNASTRLFDPEVPALNTSLDDVQGRRDDKRGRGAGTRSDKVLEPGGRVVVFEGEQVLLGCGKTTEEGKRA